MLGVSYKSELACWCWLQLQLQAHLCLLLFFSVFFFSLFWMNGDHINSINYKSVWVPWAGWQNSSMSVSWRFFPQDSIKRSMWLQRSMSACIVSLQAPWHFRRTLNFTLEKMKLHLAHHKRALWRTSPARTGVQREGVYVAVVWVPGGGPLC